MTERHSSLLGVPAFVWRLLLAAAVVAVALLRRADAGEPPCVVSAPIVAEPTPDSWIFRRSRFTHDPATGGRVAQYAMKPPIEPLDDPRAVTSGYSRTRTVLRGTDGSADTYYRVQSYGNGRGGLDAEWERFHDAWRGSTVGGGSYQSGFAPYYGYPGYATPYGYGGNFGGPSYGGPSYGRPGYGFNGVGPYGPGYGFGPGYGAPDAGLLDPDAADGYVEPRRRTPDRQFFSRGLPPREERRPGPRSERP